MARVLDLSSVAGVCGDLTPVIEAATETMEPGEEFVIRISRELAEEVDRAIETLADRLELLSREEKEDHVEYRVRVKG